MIEIIVLIFFILSIIFTIKYHFMQFKFISESKKALKNKSNYLTFLLSLGAHIGAGNIVGVTTALIIGGPGTIFWMIITTLFTTIFSLMENTLGYHYRIKIDDEYRGGSCYYIHQGLKSPFLAIIFCIFLVLSSTIFFEPIQVNCVIEGIRYIINIPKIILFIILLIFSFLVIFRGTKSILNFIEKIVPIMTLIFLGISIIAIIYKINYLPNVIKIIFKDVWNIKAGSIGVVMVGIKRSLFSNEAGLGTSPSINSRSIVDNPLQQSFLQVLTCFIDTVVMCSLLGILILIYPIEVNNYQGTELSIVIFEQILGNFGKYIGVFFLFTFSLATIVSSFYSGETNMLYLSTFYKIPIKTTKIIYKILFIFGIFLGIFMNNKTIWNLVDYGLICLGLIHLIVLILLQHDFKQDIIKSKQ